MIAQQSYCIGNIENNNTSIYGYINKISYYTAHKMSLIKYAKTGNIETIRKMIKKGKLKKEDILRKNKDGETALFLASRFGHLEIVKLLITLGNLQKEDIMMNDNYNQTALYWASYHGHLKIVKLLIKEGNLQKEDIMMKNNKGTSAYSVAKSPIKQLFNNILFNGSINDMIKDIQQSTTLLCDIK